MLCSVDLCAAEPCQNGGTCVPEAGGVSCMCVDGFIGDNCEGEINIIILKSRDHLVIFARSQF
ncbi:fibropellin-3-like, partial [Patella vulgata]|uniref:fibropellin-3-like n=1 Tax=Patella vulgata TaxID=6465 RepID=UPI0024A8072E